MCVIYLRSSIIFGCLTDDSDYSFMTEQKDICDYGGKSP